jgi:non-ribosomal peptide synthetase component F
MTTLAAFTVLLARLSGSQDMVIAVPTAGRTEEEFEGLVGLFTNIFPLRFEVPEGATFHDILGQVQRAVVAAYDHAELPFYEIVKALGSPRNLGQNPLAQVAFQFGGRSVAPSNWGDLDVREFHVPQDTTHADLEVALVTDGSTSEIEGWATFSTDLFDLRTVESWMGYFVAILSAVTAEPSQSVWNIALR